MTRAELQLALGPAAVLGEEVPPHGASRRFVARGPADRPDAPPTRMVIVHPAAPVGPVRGTMLERMAAIRALRHDSLAAPLATGMIADATWVVEPLPRGPTVADRLAASGRLSIQETVRVLRECARALSAFHRGGLSHGALDPAAIEWEGGALHRLGHAHEGAPPDDLRALGAVGWRALLGRDPAPDDRTPSAERSGIPLPLDRVVARLLDPDAAGRPASAEFVLEQLDWFPAQEATPLRPLVDGAGRGARLPRERQAAIGLALVGLALFLAWLLAGRG